MNATIKYPFRKLFIGMLFSIGCMLAMCGCSHKPTAADYRRIENNPHLSGDQKTAAIDALNPDPDTSYYQGSVLIFLVGAGLLGAAYLAKKKYDANDKASFEKSQGNGKSSHYHDDDGRKTKEKSSKAFNPQKAAAEAEMLSKYFDKSGEAEPDTKKLAESRSEVDAIPYDQRSMSFFTSRPLPLEALQKVNVKIGYRQCVVLATEVEAEQCKSGNIPRIRAFSIKGKVIPWFEWSKYDSYKHYLAMVESGWAGTHDVIPCWIKLENCDPNLAGYKAREANLK